MSRVCAARVARLRALCRAATRANLFFPFDQYRRRFSTEISYQRLANTGTQIAHLRFYGRKKYAFVNDESMNVLSNVFTELGRKDDLSGVFLRSTFPGADIRAMAAMEDWVTAKNFISRIGSLCDQIYASPFPVIAVIDNPCLGAGMELVAACDLRIAVEATATFGMPETKLGMPSVAQASLLPGLIGWGRTRELLYFGETISARKAYEWGFVNTLSSTTDLEQTVKDYEDKIDATGINAIRMQKRVMQHWQRHDAGVKGRSGFPDNEFAKAIQSKPAELRNRLGKNDAQPESTSKFNR